MDDRKHLGMMGEEFVATYLGTCLGWKIVARNWRCRVGELDIVGMDGTCLVLVEVRTRRGVNKGDVIEAIHAHKVRQLYRVLRVFLADQAFNYESIRVDAVALRVSSGIVSELVHVRNALVVDEIPRLSHV